MSWRTAARGLRRVYGKVANTFLMIAVIGAGAMGSALAIHLTRAGSATTLLGTSFDDATVDAWRSGAAHPVLRVPLPETVDCRRYDEWDEVLPSADVVVIAVSSAGLAAVVEDVASRARPDAIWTVATKGWDEATLRSPSEAVAGALGRNEQVAILAGPVLAPELVAGAPTVLVCASHNPGVARRVADSLGSAEVSIGVTDDVAGVEAAAAYKNVVAIAVGMCEGLGERLPESVYVHRFANARAATFALGLQDMSRLARARGGRAETILGPAGSGDLYVTCLAGRNGNLGRLLGAGQTPEQAQATIGSTVEGVANTRAALAVAGGVGIDIPVARAVDAVLSGRISPQEAISNVLSAAGEDTLL